jgi:hypothetical protein
VFGVRMQSHEKHLMRRGYEYAHCVHELLVNTSRDNNRYRLFWTILVKQRFSHSSKTIEFRRFGVHLNLKCGVLNRVISQESNIETAKSQLQKLNNSLKTTFS